MGCSDQPGMIALADCRSQMLAQVSPISDTETVPLAQAHKRYLATDLHAQLDMPPADNSAMDGYALKHSDGQQGQQLQVIGDALAGHLFHGTVESGQCVRITTGTQLPEGADSVIMQENTERNGNTLILNSHCPARNNVREQGEDTRKGDVILHAGRQITPADIGLLASQGYAKVPVFRRLKVALLSSGDELIAPGEPLAPGQIHDSNRFALAAMLGNAGFEVMDLGVVPDKLDAVLEAMSTADQQADAVMSSAGVSVGDADHVRTALDQLGDILVWRIAIKPGKPFAFGSLPNSQFFGLPGNPVSAMVTLQQLALPALTKMQGGNWQPPLRLAATLTQGLRKRPGREDYQRGILQRQADGELRVEPTGAQGSGLLTSMSRANCFIVIPRESSDVDAGELVQVEPFQAPLV